MRQLVFGLLLGAVLTGDAGAQQSAPKSFAPIAQGGGIEVFAKMDFDTGDNPFRGEGNGSAALAADPEHVVSGRSLHVKRAGAGGYFGARTEQIGVRGSKDLRVAFCVRSKGMTHVTVNLFDALQKDNSTPASPVRVQDGQWRTVVLAVEDFYFNSGEPAVKIKPNNEFTHLLFHGQEQPGASGEFSIDKLVIYRGRDTQAPEAPAGLKAASGSAKVLLTWQEPRDNAFAAVYSVFRKAAAAGWEKIGEAVQPRFEDAPPAPGRYTYRVTAADYDNNVSEPSADAAISVSSAGKIAAPPPATPQAQDRAVYADNVRRIYAAGRGKLRHDVFLFAGDSITAADVYTYTLGSWLGRGITVRQGVGQMRTDYGKAQIGRYLADARPEFAIVMYGTNDSKDPEAVAQAVQNLAAVIDTCAQNGTVPILATIPPRGFDPQKQQGELRFNAAVIKLCREKKVPVSYCFEEMIGRDLKQMLGDGVHLTPVAGNDAAGQALRKTIEQVYFALRDTSVGP